MEQRSKVVSIDPEGRVATPGEVNPDLVQHLERLLERARSGDIAGIAGTLTSPSGRGYIMIAETHWAGVCACTAAVGCLEMVKYRIVEQLVS